MDNSTVRGNVLVTVLVGSAAAALATAALVKRWLESKPNSASLQTLSEQTNIKPTAAEPESLGSAQFFASQAESHVMTTSASLSQWSDDQLGVRLQFSAHTLKLVSEVRQAPMITLKFSSCREVGVTVQVMIEDCERHPARSAEDYRNASVERIRDLVKIVSVSNVRVGTNVYPVVEHSYLTPTNTVMNVISIFVVHEHVGITMQFCTPGSMPKTLPAAFHELVRTIKFSPPKPSSSYLFCAEPRLGVGFRVPLTFKLVLTPEAGESDFGQDGPPFATLVGTSSNVTIVARNERHCQLSWAQLIDKLLWQSFERFSVAGTPRFVFQSTKSSDAGDAMVMRSCSIVAPTRDVEFGRTAGDASDASSRTIGGYFCFHEVAVDTAHSRDVGFETFNTILPAYFCLYCFSIGHGEYLTLSFLSPDTHDLSTFVQFCQSVAYSLSLGNHYGQETSLTYCNLRHFCEFHVSISSHLSVREPLLGDPVCVLRSTEVTDSAITLRIIPCPRDHASEQFAKFESDLLLCARQLGGGFRLLEHGRQPLSSFGGVVVWIVHEHDFSDDSALDEVNDDEHLQNPLCHFDEENDVLDVVSTWTSAIVCVDGKAYVFQTISNEYCCLASRSVLEDVVNAFAPF